jgi:hypothetical protein
MNNKQEKTYTKLVFLVIIVAFALFLSNKLSQKYPTIIIDKSLTYASHEAISNISFSDVEGDGKSICGPLENMTLFVDDTRINEGDPIEIGVQYKAQKPNVSLKVSIDQEYFVNIKDGQRTTIGLGYYRMGRNIVYYRECVPNPRNDQCISAGGSNVGFYISRPSFLDSGWGKVISTFAFIILLGETLRIIFYFSDFDDK